MFSLGSVLYDQRPVNQEVCVHDRYYLSHLNAYYDSRVCLFQQNSSAIGRQPFSQRLGNVLISPKSLARTQHNIEHFSQAILHLLPTPLVFQRNPPDARAVRKHGAEIHNGNILGTPYD